jgi:hypothetical protein
MKSSRNCTSIIRLVTLVGLLTLTMDALGAQLSSLRGKVTVTQKPLASASVSVYLLNQQQSKSVGQWATLTSTDGTFVLGSLPYGTYVVLIRYQGRIVVQKKIQLNTEAGQELVINLKR